MYLKIILFCIMLFLTGCAGIAQSSRQFVNFTTPNKTSFSDNNNSLPTIKRDTSYKQDDINKKEKSVEYSQNSLENYQSLQNNLLGIAGKLADLSANINKVLEVNSKIIGLEGDVAALKAENVVLKTKIKAEITAEVKSQIQSEIAGIKTTFNNNSNLPFSFMASFVFIVVTFGGGLIFVIYQNSKQQRVLRTLSENTPVILPIQQHKDNV